MVSRQIERVALDDLSTWEIVTEISIEIVILCEAQPVKSQFFKSVKWFQLNCKLGKFLYL